MHIKFWGTRGSIANASPQNVRYGGNTSCVEVRSEAGTLLVLDCGTGGFALGQSLVTKPHEACRGNLLISHTHWDHIQGIPFFAPLFNPLNKWDIFGPKSLNESLRDTLAGQMKYAYCPITLEELACDIEYHELVEGVFKINDFHVKAQFLNHPGLTLGYRLEVDNVSVVYACDHEQVCKQAIPSEKEMDDMEARHIGFLKDADVVIHDCQYTADTYEGKAGWGHSTVEFAVAACLKANVKKLVITHHDPSRDDDSIDKIVKSINKTLKKNKQELVVVAAAEHETLEVKPVESGAFVKKSAGSPAMGVKERELQNHVVLLGKLAPEVEKLVRESALAEKLEVFSFNSSMEKKSVEAAFRSHTVALIVIDERTSEKEIIKMQHRMRQQSEEGAPGIPFVVIATEKNGEHVHADVATEIVSWPFSEQFIRTKLQSWVVRTTCRWIRAEKPKFEELRLATLHDLDFLNTEPDEKFDRITKIAADALQVPIVLISLVDKDTQRFKSCIGMNVRETSREVAFCSHAILDDAPLVINDTLLDNRFADNPLVTSKPHIRFYAGAPIKAPNSLPLGTLCLIDTKPRRLNDRELGILTNLSAMVEREIASRVGPLE